MVLSGIPPPSGCDRVSINVSFVRPSDALVVLRLAESESGRVRKLVC
jgi:hypothetical protein